MSHTHALDSATLAEFRQVLERKRSELIHSWLHPNELIVERFADAMDDWVSAAARELMVEQINRNAVTLAEIDDALRHLAEGTYGSCRECGYPILPKRLAALPWAIHCLYCQQRRDLEREGRANSVGSERLSDAA